MCRQHAELLLFQSTTMVFFFYHLLSRLIESSRGIMHLNVRCFFRTIFNRERTRACVRACICMCIYRLFFFFVFFFVFLVDHANWSRSVQNSYFIFSANCYKNEEKYSAKKYVTMYLQINNGGLHFLSPSTLFLFYFALLFGVLFLSLSLH